MDRLMPDYVDALEQELVFARERYPFQQLETVYIGGGTPSLLPAAEVSRLLEFIRRNFNVAPDAEVTLEANPASTDETKIAAWLEGGVNRLSLGVQGFDPRALAVLERKTDAAQAVRAFSLAREMGMSNVSIDLIYAVPFQSLETWLETLRRAIALGPDHVSTYCLSFEEGTLLHRRRAEGKVPEVETDLQWDQLDAACASWRPPVSAATRCRTGPIPASSRATTTRTGAAGPCMGLALARTRTPPMVAARRGGGTSRDHASTSPPRDRPGPTARSWNRARRPPNR